MKVKFILVLLIALLASSAPVLGAKEDEVDYLELAALMLRDGNLDRARVALDNVDLEAEALDIGRYHTLRGMTHLRSNELEQARDAFQKVIEVGTPDSVIYVYLAQISYGLEDYTGTIEALDQAGNSVDRVPAVYNMRAQCYWLLERPHQAIATLDQASLVFPDDHQFQRRKVFYLIELGLFREAADLGKDYLGKSEGKAEDYVAIGDALRRSGDVEQALKFLEAAGLLYADNTLVKKALAHAYLDKGELNAAAEIIYQAAFVDPALLPEAVELYRRAGQLHQALSLNSRLADQPEKLKQRLALLLELQRYEQAAAMGAALYRVGLLEDEDIRYALAYALFKSGDFGAAEQHLSQLTRSDLFRKSTELRRAMEDCNDEPWRCI